MSILSLKDIHRTYRQGPKAVEVLRGAELELQPGEIVGLLGPSGSGKSTLLHLAGLLEKPDSGTVFMDGVDCTPLSDKERTRIRRRKIGFVYQFHHLLPEFSALENVMIPQRIRNLSRGRARKRASELLTRLGLRDRLTHRPAELSGGEQQRVAIARAIANDPVVLLADEPTGNLDEDTAETVFQSLIDMTRRNGLAALIATHNTELAKRMDRAVYLREGKLYKGPQRKKSSR